MTSRSSTTAAAACPPGARTLGATAPPSLGAAVVARWSRVELPAVHEGGIEGRRSRSERTTRTDGRCGSRRRGRAEERSQTLAAVAA